MYSISETLKWTFAATKQHWKLLAGISLLNLIPATMQLLSSGTEGVHAPLVTGSLGAALLALSGLLGLIIGILSYVCLFHVGAVAVAGGELTKSAFSQAIKTKLASLVLVYIFVILFLVTWAPTIVGYFIATVFTSLSLPVLFVENKRGTDALATSIALVKGKAWKVFGTFVLAGILMVVLSLIVFFAAGFVAGVSGTSLVGFIAMFVATAIMYSFITPFMIMALFGVYRSARAVTAEPDTETHARRRKFVKVCLWIAPVIIVAILVIGSVLIASVAMQ